ncbi:Hypothetical predicted protein [Paramuricea clavata]|uniref:Uncharacterized protein n=1 Tax=Paramuricea clavata TaxID=317549 RepID=A0A7D9II12_PARCT|nr:Hypothetical predicted protein [Paramuricea clavata]
MMQNYVMQQSVLNTITEKISSFLKSSASGTSLGGTADHVRIASIIENTFTTNVEVNKIINELTESIRKQTVRIHGKGKVVIGHISLTENTKLITDVVSNSIESSKFGSKILTALDIKGDSKTTGFMTGFNNLLTSTGLSMQTFMIILPVVLISAAIIGLLFFRWMFKSDPIQIRAMGRDKNEGKASGSGCMQMVRINPIPVF